MRMQLVPKYHVLNTWRLRLNNARANVEVALHGVRLTCNRQHTLPRAAVHVESSGRVLHQFRDGDEHLVVRDKWHGSRTMAEQNPHTSRKEKDVVLFEACPLHGDSFPRQAAPWQ